MSAALFVRLVYKLFVGLLVLFVDMISHRLLRIGVAEARGHLARFEPHDVVHDQSGDLKDVLILSENLKSHLRFVALSAKTNRSQ